MNSTEIVPAKMFDIEGAKTKLQQWEEAKTKVLHIDYKNPAQSDVIKIGGSLHIKRSGWRKLALAANVTTEVLDVKLDSTSDAGESDFTAVVTAKATTSWGRSAEDIGAYSASEFVDKSGAKMKISRHNVIARAATRALNRAISDLVGGGVSAEEVVPVVEELRQADRDDIAIALREYEGKFTITEALDKTRVTVRKLSEDEFKKVRDILKEFGAEYVAAKEGGPAFDIRKGGE